ncbi:MULTISPECIES: hypothetical protein [unclassified Tenacibaculum]|uniref:hypothetical protein n=1 Tax=unclassified Tenacibaculum TaxID=2635139 RepID=UPI001F3ABAD2|nr:MULTISPECIES: hypothetical protein [unclassified Tenacibaculum]MCF2873954.1 hypothetical protein [Tenacibaculum sp. Cn5-1]MCF2934535.1 hypothetical protein [Tenacibaculum sp. Cn5-34]MCG7510745.1 hypothetical protein [Tenacibaculum sp. Cn5-46]
MKKVIALFVLLLSFASVSYSQETNSKEINEKEFLTSGKWFVETVQIGNEVQKFSQKDSWMVFHADGNYQVVMSSHEKNGHWKLNKEHKVILEEESQETDLKIEVLSETELLFSATDGDIAYSMKLSK